MQSEDYRNLEFDVFTKLASRLGQSPKEEIRISVEQAFKEMTDEQKIMSLSPDEVQLLVDFRRWSQSPGSASGVFHWRKQYGK